MRILLAEDDAETAGFVREGLAAIGHEVIIAPDGEQAFAIATDQPFDMLILDRMLPGLDGLTLLRQLRAAGLLTPAIMLTALGQIEDRVQGLDAGADDYLVKPFDLAELAARINAQTRRNSAVSAQTRFVAGPITLDLLTREVRRDGRVILLQPREFRLLEELLRAGGEYLTRAMLLERVWGYHFDPQTKIVETHMSRLRAKLNAGGLNEAGLDDRIETVRGTGYRIRIG